MGRCGCSFGSLGSSDWRAAGELRGGAVGSCGQPKLGLNFCSISVYQKRPFLSRPGPFLDPPPFGALNPIPKSSLLKPIIFYFSFQVLSFKCQVF